MACSLEGSGHFAGRQALHLPHTGPSHVADVVDSKEHLRFRAMCDERISFPFEELRGFPDVYSKLEPYEGGLEMQHRAMVVG